MSHLKKIEEVFAVQKKVSIQLRAENIAVRKARLTLLENWILANRGEIQTALYSDMMKPSAEVDRSEIFPLLSEIRYAKRNLRRWAHPNRMPGNLTYVGTSARVYYEPKGVCLIIAPWNFPLLLTLGPLVSALSAGNTVFLKPSEFTPAISALILKMSEDLFDSSLVFTVEGDATISSKLLTMPFDHIFFTGSPQVGKIVMKAAAEVLASVTLELGGKSPTIVDETSNIRDVANKIAWGKWLNAGQTCIAPDYIFVHNHVKSKLLDELKRQANKLYSDKSNYTSIVNDKHFQRLESIQNDALIETGNVYHKGSVDEATRTISPSIYIDVPSDSAMMSDEIFGPILPVLGYDDLDEVIRFINDRAKPLACYCFSESRKNQQRIIKEISSGTMVINDCVLQFAHPSLPFGGVNNSGFGKSHGRHGFLAFSNEKSVLKQRVSFSLSRVFHPPYTNWKNRLVDILIKYF